MKRASQLQDLRDEQRDEMMKKTAAERIAIALELSDACIELSKAAKKAIEAQISSSRLDRQPTIAVGRLLAVYHDAHYQLRPPDLHPHVARRDVLAEVLPDPFLQLLASTDIDSEPDEEDNPLVSRPHACPTRGTATPPHPKPGNIQQITEVVSETARGAHETATAAAQLTTLARDLERSSGVSSWRS